MLRPMHLDVNCGAKPTDLGLAACNAIPSTVIDSLDSSGNAFILYPFTGYPRQPLSWITSSLRYQSHHCTSRVFVLSRPLESHRAILVTRRRHDLKKEIVEAIYGLRLFNDHGSSHRLTLQASDHAQPSLYQPLIHQTVIISRGRDHKTITPKLKPSFLKRHTASVRTCHGLSRNSCGCSAVRS